MKNQFNYYSVLFTFLVALSTTLNSCKPDEHNHDEHDAITKLQLAFIDSATNSPFGTFTWADPDGIGGNNPTQIDTITLLAGNTYRVNISVFAQHDSHEDNITADILNEKNDHLFVYKNIIGNLSIQITDKDDNNLPIGIETKWISGASSIGQVNILLRHQPGIKNGTESPGDTDVDITMPLQVQ